MGAMHYCTLSMFMLRAHETDIMLCLSCGLVPTQTDIMHQCTQTPPDTHTQTHNRFHFISLLQTYDVRLPGNCLSKQNPSPHRGEAPSCWSARGSRSPLTHTIQPLTPSLNPSFIVHISLTGLLENSALDSNNIWMYSLHWRGHKRKILWVMRETHTGRNLFFFFLTVKRNRENREAVCMVGGSKIFSIVWWYYN